MKALCVAVFSMLILPSLLLAEDPGQTMNERGYLGFRLTSRGDRALVGDIAPDGPGAKAGLKDGDAVIAFNGVPFLFKSDHALIRGLEWIRPGVPVQLTLVRNQKEMDVEVVPTRFAARDLAALEDWLRRADLTEQGQRKACAFEAFKALAAPPGIEVILTKSPDGKGFAMTATRHKLPEDLDLSEPFLDYLLRGIKPGDTVTLRYEWSRGALRSEVVKAPEYVNLEEISRQALGKMKETGAKVR